MKQLYSTCLTDEQWDFIKHHFRASLPQAAALGVVDEFILLSPEVCSVESFT